MTLVVGCEHKSKKDDNTPPADKVMGSAAPGAAKPAPAPTEMKAEPVAKDPAQDPGAAKGADPAAKDPARSADEVRPPVAADLAEYTKDIAGNGPLSATIETNQGTFHCQLHGDKSPATVANFVGLATGKKAWLNPKTGAVEKGKPFYDGLTFHRVIPEFMIQGGDPLGVGSGGPGYAFADEVNNGLVMKPGVMAMANTGRPVTNGSQFFITETAPDWLNNRHTIFGQCKEVDLVKKITALRGPGDRPQSPVTINKVTISKG